MTESLSTDPTTANQGTRMGRRRGRSCLAPGCSYLPLALSSVLSGIEPTDLRGYFIALLHRCMGVFFLVLVFGSLAGLAGSATDVELSDGPAPSWEPLLWGGKIVVPGDEVVASGSLTHDPGERRVDEEPTSPTATPEQDLEDAPSPAEGVPQADRFPRVIEENSGIVIAPYREPVLAVSYPEIPRSYVDEPFQPLLVKNIPPLYVTPRLPGEGIWDWRGMPGAEHGRPAIYRTTYRPSAHYPNAIVHMLLFDMKKVSMRLYIGSGEPGASRTSSRIEPENRNLLLAVTNALWKQKHSMGGGAIFRGDVLQKLSPGMATLVVYCDDSVDVLEWNEGIPLSMVSDARQLRHLIVKDGRVVESITQRGQNVDSEIGLGYLLSEDQQSPYAEFWGGWYQSGYGANYAPDWFIATRSAFGIRRDGNLVFAIGHHISTKDLAKALVLAGCDRAIHGDANPHNVLGNLYYAREDGNITKAVKLSPDQREDTLRRYVDRAYSSDFFAFFRKSDKKDPS